MAAAAQGSTPEASLIAPRGLELLLEPEPESELEPEDDEVVVGSEPEPRER